MSYGGQQLRACEDTKGPAHRMRRPFVTPLSRDRVLSRRIHGLHASPLSIGTPPWNRFGAPRGLGKVMLQPGALPGAKFAVSPTLAFETPSKGQIR